MPARVLIGNFDGVHRGHQILAATARADSNRDKLPLTVLTFEPHPRRFLKPAEPFFQLTDPGIKTTLLQLLGADTVKVLRFDAELAALSAKDFFDKILMEQCQAASLVAGQDFHFGHKRQGTPAYLAALCALNAVELKALPARRDTHGDVISSSHIRDALARGDVAAANMLLGYRWLARGRVQKGDQRGRALGFPTANIALPAGCGLKQGVYAARAYAKSAWYAAAAHFGTRVQFGGGAPLLEVHLLDFEGNLYGDLLRVEFCDFVRAEAAFESVAHLVAHMQNDIEKVRERLARVLQHPATDVQHKLESATFVAPPDVEPGEAS